MIEAEDGPEDGQDHSGVDSAPDYLQRDGGRGLRLCRWENVPLGKKLGHILTM